MKEIATVSKQDMINQASIKGRWINLGVKDFVVTTAEVTTYDVLASSTKAQQGGKYLVELVCQPEGHDDKNLKDFSFYPNDDRYSLSDDGTKLTHILRPAVMGDALAATDSDEKASRYWTNDASAQVAYDAAGPTAGLSLGSHGLATEGVFDNFGNNLGHTLAREADIHYKPIA